MKKPHLLGAFCACLAMLGSHTLQASVVYNLSLDFSLSSNPNDTWQYGSGSFGVFSAFDVSGSPASYGEPDLNGWTLSTVNSYHTVSKNTSASAFTITDVMTLNPGEMVMHPGPAGEYAMVRWTTPVSGDYDINGIFSLLDPTGGSTSIHLAINGIELLSETSIITNFGASATVTPSLSLTVGDTLDFMVGSNGTWSDDSTKVSLEITQSSVVPVPAAVWLFGSGLLGLVGIARRKKA